MWQALSVRNVPFPASQERQNVALDVHVAHDESHAVSESLLRRTLADAALVGKHPIGTPKADTPVVESTILRLCTCSVCERDKGIGALNALPILIHDAITFEDAVCRVEAEGTIVTCLTDSPVGSSAVLRRAPRAVVEDDVSVAPETPITVTQCARRAHRREQVRA